MSEGQQRWAVNVQGYIDFSSPAVSMDGATVYVGVITETAGHVVALTSQGILKWRRNLPQAVDSSPAVNQDAVYVGCVDGQLYALNPDTGVPKWSRSTLGAVTSSPALGSNGIVYVGSRSGYLHAFDRDGNLHWTFKTDDRIESSPAIGADGTIYIGSDDRHLYAITPEGGLKWRFGPTGGKIFSSPAIGADGTIYVGSADQKLYAITPAGALKWEYFSNGDIQASPVIGADGTIYFGADVHLYALNPEGPGENRVKWRAEINTTLASTAAVRGDGVIIVGGDDGRVRALNPDGSPRWLFNTRINARDEDYVESSPVIAPDGSIYVGSSSGRLFKIEGNGSPLSQYSSWPAFRRDASHSGRAVTTVGSGHLVNLSARTRASSTSPPPAAGFFVYGEGPKAFMVRGVGPTLQRFGVSSFMPDPRLDLYAGGTTRPLRSNDNWEEGNQPGTLNDTAETLAFPLPPGSKDAAVLEPLFPGLYSAVVSSADGRDGVVLIEVYDAVGGTTDTRLFNISLRNRAGAGEDVLTMGFVLQGFGPTRLLVRAVGPGLAPFGVTDFLARPSMALFRGNAPIRSNTGWASEGLTFDLTTAMRQVGAFGLADRSNDSAMIVTLDPGDYTVQVSGTNGAMGEVLAEVYILP